MTWCGEASRKFFFESKNLDYFTEPFLIEGFSENFFFDQKTFLNHFLSRGGKGDEHFASNPKTVLFRRNIWREDRNRRKKEVIMGLIGAIVLLLAIVSLLLLFLICHHLIFYKFKGGGFMEQTIHLVRTHARGGWKGVWKCVQKRTRGKRGQQEAYIRTWNFFPTFKQDKDQEIGKILRSCAITTSFIFLYSLFKIRCSTLSRRPS